MVDEISNEEETEEMDDADATLGDDVLDEVAGDEEEDDEEEEGFGHIDEKDVSEDDEEEEEDDAALEEDAEDVDYDSFDDVDEM